MPLTSQELSRFDQRLRARRDELKARINADLSETDREHLNEIIGRVRDAGEESLAEFTVNTSLALLQREIDELREVEAALVRLHDGSYGVCEECGNPIELERLLAYPAAVRCLDDQQLQERRRSGGADMSPSL